MNKQLLQKTQRIGGVICLVFSLFITSCYAQEKTASAEESLFLRRIGEFWKEGDYREVKEQILDFLSKYPQNSMNDSLQAILGDLYFQEKEYQNAFSAYDVITDDGLQAKTLFNYLRCLLELKDYKTVLETAELTLKQTPSLEEDLKKDLHFLASEALFQLGIHAEKPEDQKAFIAQAMPHYKALKNTKFASLSLYHIAESFKILEKYQKAGAVYTFLASKNPGKREELLFQAASMQAHTDKKEAIKTFGKIVELNGTLARQAAFNQLVMLYETQNYQELLKLQSRLQTKITPEKAAIAQFYIGKSYYALGDYKNAVKSLESYLEQEKTPSSQCKTALLNLFVSARQINDLALFDRALQKFQTAFPNDPNAPIIQAMRAKLCMEIGDFSQAASQLEQIASQCPDLPAKEGLFFDFAVLQAKARKWQDARQAFIVFLEKFPTSASAPTAYKQALHCSLQALRENPSNQEKEALVSLLYQILDKKQILNEDQRGPSHHLLIKTLYELQKYQEVLTQAEKYLQTDSKSVLCREVHLIAALSAKKSPSALALFISHAEKALMLNPHLEHAEELHLELFNAHIALSKTQAQKEHYRQAADHLFAIYDKAPISLDNQLWLADHFYEEAKEVFASKGSLQNNLEAKRSLERAFALYQKILLDEKEELDPLVLEEETMKLAHLFSMNEKPSDQMVALKGLIQRQKDHPEISWKQHRSALFELAQAYERAQEFEEALAIYDDLLESPVFISSQISQSAKLQRARLEYAGLEEEQKKENTAELSKILSDLKDLEIQKRLRSEPIHLEAALEYAFIRSSLAPPEMQMELSHFYLSRLKENFDVDENGLPRDYQSARKDFPAQFLLSQSYLSFVDAELLRLEALIARQNGQEEIAGDIEKMAKEKLQALLEGQTDVTPYLLNHVERSLQAMKN